MSQLTSSLPTPPISEPPTTQLREITVIIKDKETLKDPDVEDKPVLKFLNVRTGLQDPILKLEATNNAIK
jgi:hypothetical protein